ncbi:MAG: anthranilate synthase component I family protein [Actinobacteria bacterium]|nr:anthranilate synthase component I family protein [Actinomycetota bacterium]
MEFGFYRNGLWARDLVEISDDPASIGDGNFWAVLITYEGKMTFARFADVERNSEGSFFGFADTQPWQHPTSSWQSSLSREEYVEAVAQVRSAIARGEVYQINLCRTLTTSTESTNLLGVMSRLRRGNPAPYLTSLELPEISIASASPELLLKREGSLITSSPIKGTAKNPDEFLEKDRAENVMIVDLVRHDFGSICTTGSIHVPRLLGVEEHPGLAHLVSDIQGTLRSDISWGEIFSAILPAGSISGAPKSSAIDLIAKLEELEDGERGPYCGAIGWVHGARAELAVGIRTFWLQSGTLKFGTGAGITWGSDAELEWAETELKASRLLSIVNHR